MTEKGKTERSLSNNITNSASPYPGEPGPARYRKLRFAGMPKTNAVCPLCSMLSWFD